MFEEVFSEHNYEFRPKRSCESAVIKALEYMNDGYDWIVDMDLSKFFDNVNQDILMILVHKVIKDPDTESLIRRVLQSGVMVEGVFQETKIGTPQGGNLSPLLANIYLNELDVELMRRGLRFTRYADDVIICVRSEVAANRVMRTVTEWLEKHLRVKVNMTKTKVCRPNGLKYLGYSFFQRNGWKPKPHIKSVEKLKAKLHELTIRSKSILMFVVESILAEIEWKNLFEKKVLLYCAIRLIIYPFLVFIALTFLNAPTLIKAIAVIMTGMPAGSTTAILAEQYGCDAKFAAKLILVSTVLSVITIPILCLGL